MAEPSRLDQALSRLFEANLRWYEALGRVSADYVRAVTRIVGDSVTSRPSSTAPDAAARPFSAPAPQAPAPQAVTLVLEAEKGQLAQGLFMVENRLPRQVSASVVTSAFVDPDQRQVWPTIRVQPGNLTLEPGARALVQISATIDDTLGEGLRYQGQVSVPGLSDAPIPVVLRRRATSAPTPAPTTDAAGSAEQKPAGEMRRGGQRKGTQRRARRRQPDNG